MKAKVIAGIGVLVLVIALCFALKPESFDKKFEKTMKDMDTYLLEGDMEITKGEDVKAYVVKVGYQKKDEKEFFKVSLYDKALNQEQIILRNQEGVFVVTPSLNQVFKFEGDWPMNTPKPYLLQSMVDIVKGDKAKITEEKDGYLVTSKVVYPSNKDYSKEELMFDKDAKIQWLQIFNKEGSPELKIVFHKVKYNQKMDKNYFKAPSKLETKTSSSSITDADLPLYPMEVFGSKLSGKSTVEVEGEQRHVLEYTGEYNFTVVESVISAPNETQTVLMPGKMIDMLDLVGFYDGNRMSVVESGVEYTVYSDDLEPEEMMNVIASMQVAVMK